MSTESIGPSMLNALSPNSFDSNRGSQNTAARAPERASVAELKPDALSKQPDKPDAEQLQQALEEVQDALSPVARDLLFSLDEDLGKTIVKVVDSSTEEVIRQIPSDEMLAIARALDKLQGVLFKQEA